jgi:hypothetical protein
MEISNSSFFPLLRPLVFFDRFSVIACVIYKRNRDSVLQEILLFPRWGGIRV